MMRAPIRPAAPTTTALIFSAMSVGLLPHLSLIDDMDIAFKKNFFYLFIPNLEMDDQSLPSPRFHPNRGIDQPFECRDQRRGHHSCSAGQGFIFDPSLVGADRQVGTVHDTDEIGICSCRRKKGMVPDRP